MAWFMRAPPPSRRLGPLPAAFVVIRLRPPPLARCLAQGQPAEAAGVDGRLQHLVGVGETRGKNGAELHLVTVTCGDDTVAAVGGDFQRFLDDDVLARLGGGDGRLQMCAAWRGDDHGMNVGPGQHRGQVRGQLAVWEIGFPSHFLGRGPTPADQGRHAGAGNLGQSPGMKPGDHAAADDARSSWPLPKLTRVRSSCKSAPRRHKYCNPLSSVAASMAQIRMSRSNANSHTRVGPRGSK